MIAANPSAAVLLVVVPGTPVAQGRGRAVRFGASVRVIDPAASRSWKGAAQVHMLQARQAARVFAPFDVPLVVTIDAYWPRPKSMRKALGTGRLVRPSRPDADNVAKATLDAGNGVLWTDDAIAVDVRSRKWFAAEGDGPRVEISIEPYVDAAAAAVKGA